MAVTLLAQPDVPPEKILAVYRVKNSGLSAAVKALSDVY
jgi:hypothetical protein